MGSEPQAVPVNAASISTIRDRIFLIVFNLKLVLRKVLDLLSIIVRIVYLGKVTPYLIYDQILSGKICFSLPFLYDVIMDDLRN